MEFKGTKGEWIVEKELGYDCDVIYKGGEICWLGLSDVIDEEKVANAKLIAAAPELLEACVMALEAVKELHEHQEGWHEEQSFLEAAINKALN
jgi:hypothetical protein